VAFGAGIADDATPRARDVDAVKDRMRHFASVDADGAALWHAFSAFDQSTNSKQRRRRPMHALQQVDVANLISALLGTRIPDHSVGETPVHLLAMTARERVLALLHNAQQLQRLYAAMMRRIASGHAINGFHVDVLDFVPTLGAWARALTRRNDSAAPERARWWTRRFAALDTFATDARRLVAQLHSLKEHEKEGDDNEYLMRMEREADALRRAALAGVAYAYTYDERFFTLMFQCAAASLACVALLAMASITMPAASSKPRFAVLATMQRRRQRSVLLPVAAATACLVTLCVAFYAYAQSMPWFVFGVPLLMSIAGSLSVRRCYNGSSSNGVAGSSSFMILPMPVGRCARLRRLCNTVWQTTTQERREDSKVIATTALELLVFLSIISVATRARVGYSLLWLALFLRFQHFGKRLVAFAVRRCCCRCLSSSSSSSSTATMMHGNKSNNPENDDGDGDGVDGNATRWLMPFLSSSIVQYGGIFCTLALALLPLVPLDEYKRRDVHLVIGAASLSVCAVVLWFAAVVLRRPLAAMSMQQQQRGRHVLMRGGILVPPMLQTALLCFAIYLVWQNEQQEGSGAVQQQQQQKIVCWSVLALSFALLFFVHRAAWESERHARLHLAAVFRVARLASLALVVQTLYVFVARAYETLFLLLLMGALADFVATMLHALRLRLLRHRHRHRRFSQLRASSSAVSASVRLLSVMTWLLATLHVAFFSVNRLQLLQRFKLRAPFRFAMLIPAHWAQSAVYRNNFELCMYLLFFVYLLAPICCVVAWFLHWRNVSNALRRHYSINNNSSSSSSSSNSSNSYMVVKKQTKDQQQRQQQQTIRSCCRDNMLALLAVTPMCCALSVIAALGVQTAWSNGDEGASWSDTGNTFVRFAMYTLCHVWLSVLFVITSLLMSIDVFALLIAALSLLRRAACCCLGCYCCCCFSRR
jgi:hypothetical protein